MSVVMRIGGGGRVNVGSARRVLFENVVLDRPGELVLRHTLFAAYRDIECQRGWPPLR